MRRYANAAVLQRRLIRILVAVSLVGGSVLTVAAPASAASVWSITPSVDANNFALGGVSCLSAATNCWAVGSITPAVFALAGAAEVEHWNGSRWSLVASPAPGGSMGTWLDAVSCPSANSCYAVGFVLTKADVDQGYVEHWNGNRWSVMPSPEWTGRGDVSLIAVSCSSTASCVAIGGATTPEATIAGVVERWDGTRWSLSTLPNPKVGTWSYGGPSGVTCRSATYCLVVSTAYVHGDFYTFVEHWNGTRWSIMPSPNVTSDTELSGVSCPSARSCFAVGRYFTGSDAKTLVEHWNGTRWSLRTSPNPASQAELFSVSCPTTNSCYAVGDSSTTTATTTLVEQWNGSRWSIDPSPNPTGAAFALLGDVSCSNTHSCFATGYSAKTADTFPGPTLIERYA